MRAAAGALEAGPTDVANRARALDAGYHGHVPKPVEPTELVAVVATLAGRAAAG